MSHPIVHQPTEDIRSTTLKHLPAGIAVAKVRGVYCGRRKGTTKAKPQRVLALRRTGLTVPEIARALGIGERTAFRYLAVSAAAAAEGEHC